MKNQLRAGVEKMRHYYIQRLLGTGTFTTKDQILYSFTLSELKSLAAKVNKP
ncbi:Fur-regulated basic protein FbpA [Falsibacillus albus]|uniref:Fur-regulated basic protein FbpA n=1 Tax=Falsibacillus albus TaxID=2478915 RepID=A0A3L7KA12_9BACI|nr:Fur-regulated basic protein FbpA [Falsibacillus albus]RLQ97492.1 Fur-regulated basic protein FbpA [Falsibacillus albus]